MSTRFFVQCIQHTFIHVSKFFPFVTFAFAISVECDGTVAASCLPFNAYSHGRILKGFSSINSPAQKKKSPQLINLTSSLRLNAHMPSRPPSGSLICSCGPTCGRLYMVVVCVCVYTPATHQTGIARSVKWEILLLAALPALPSLFLLWETYSVV